MSFPLYFICNDDLNISAELISGLFHENFRRPEVSSGQKVKNPNFFQVKKTFFGLKKNFKFFYTAVCFYQILNIFTKKIENFSKFFFGRKIFFPKIFTWLCVLSNFKHICKKKFFSKLFFSKMCEIFFSQLSDNFVVRERNVCLHLRNLQQKFELPSPKGGGDIIDLVRITN